MCIFYILRIAKKILYEESPQSLPKEEYNLVHKEKILSFYVSKGYFNYGLINKINNRFSFKSIPLILKYKNDIIKETESNPEGTNVWYNNNYYTYGIQKIKNTLNNKVKVNRRVFFISNFEIIK